MSDKVRGALFNTLGDIEDLTVLDAFAGSGAMCFEAVSRGAASALAIENDKPAQRSVAGAIRELRLGGQVKLIQANCSGWSDNNPEARFDLVIADPPFDQLQLTVIGKLTRHVRQSGGLFILNWPGRSELPDLEGLEIIERKSYGDTQLAFYRHPFEA